MGVEERLRALGGNVVRALVATLGATHGDAALNVGQGVIKLAGSITHEDDTENAFNFKLELTPQ